MGVFYNDINNKNFTNRFTPSKFMEFDPGVGFCPLNSYFFMQLLDLPAFGIYEVEKNIGRPDNISWELYETYNHTYNLLYYNGLTTFDDVFKGMKLRYPSSSDLDTLYQRAVNYNIGRKRGFVNG